MLYMHITHLYVSTQFLIVRQMTQKLGAQFCFHTINQEKKSFKPLTECLQLIVVEICQRFGEGCGGGTLLCANIL
jgi:hypothetical protein